MWKPLSCASTARRAIVAPCLLMLVGCGDRDVVRRYQVPHETSPASSAAADVQVISQRLLGAIIAGEGQAWFVKLLGPAEQVAGVADIFEQVIGSLRFPGEKDGPTWTCPPGWAERGADENRFATLEAEGLEIAISKLPWDSTEWDGYILANLNRWRRQVQLPPVPAEGLADAGQRTEIDGHPAFVVDLTGEAMASAGGAAPNLMSAGGAGASASGAGSLKYETPEGWIVGRTTAFRVAAFDIERAGQKAELTVIPLGAASGSLLDNVNRWRGQIGLEAIDQAELDATVKSLTVDGIESSYIEIAPPDGAEPASMILAVVVPRSGQTVFIKLLGDRQLVADEQPNFEQFVQSLRFPASP